MTWSKYERDAWDDIQLRKKHWYEKAQKDSWTTRAGERISQAAGGAGKAVKRVPGAEKAMGAFATVLAKGQKALTDIAARTMTEQEVLRAYRKRGTTVNQIGELRGLDLEELDRVVHKQRLDQFYGGIAAAEGFVAGAVISASDIAALIGGVAGEGVGAAPGFGMIAAGMTVDVATVLALSARAVAETAMCYGFDPNDPREQVFALGILNVGSAVTQGAKYTALSDLSKLTQGLARGATWAQLDKHAATQIAKAFAGAFEVRLTKQKLGQIVPVAGIVVASTLNYATVSEVQRSAYWAYRERLLVEKNPEAINLVADAFVDIAEGGEPMIQDTAEAGAIDLVGIIEEIEAAPEADDSLRDDA